jgi:hypothetical protein
MGISVSCIARIALVLEVKVQKVREGGWRERGREGDFQIV